MQELKIHIKGLFTYASDLVDAPDGALAKADDIVIDRENIAEPRRGFNQAFGSFSDTTYRANKQFFYQDYLISHYSTNLLAYYNTVLNTTGASFTTTGAWTPIAGTYLPPSGDKIRSVKANRNFYFTTSAGVYKMDAFSSTPVRSGSYKGLDVSAALSASASTWLGDQYRTAYRVLWGYRDANNNLIQGSPSQIESFKNTSGATKAVDLTITIPAGVSTAWFYQIYRAAAVLDNSLVTGVEPNDEMGLVYEGNPLATDISAGTLTVSDITPDVLRGATLYTSPSQQGISAASEQAPMAYDVAVYKNTVFYANTTSKQRLFLNLLAAGGASGVVAGDTLSVGGVVYTASTAETISTNTFRAYQSGTTAFVDGNVNTSTSVITATAHGMQSGDLVVLTTTGVLPTGLLAGRAYYIVTSTTNTFQLSLTKAGAPVTITAAAGGGTHTATYGNSASQNIRDTATSLIRVVNRSVSSTIYAFYLSGPNVLPGKMLIEEKSIGGGVFCCGASRPSSWSSTPATSTAVASVNTGTSTITATAHGLVSGDGVVFSVGSGSSALPGGVTAGTVYYVTAPTTNTIQIALTAGGTAIALGAGFVAVVTINKFSILSKADRFQNGICFSKVSEPESVPLTNVFYAGSADSPIRRILPLRDSLFIMKDDGIYRLSGESANSFRVDLFDATVKILAPDTGVVLNNQLWCLSDQGVVAVTESGAQVKSRPIEFSLKSLQGINLPVLKSESFAVSYETERKYVLFVPTTSVDTTPTQAYVYNTFTNTWTRWVLNKKCGIVGPADDKLYLGPADGSYVNQERKSLDFTDYCDYGFASTVSAIDASMLILTISNTGNIGIGDVIYQSASKYSIVSAVNSVSGTVTTTFQGNFATGAVSVLKSIKSKIGWLPFAGGNPGMLKHYREVTVMFKQDFQGAGTLVFTSDASLQPENETVTGTALGQWGLFTWGGVPWGGSGGRRPIRVWIPDNKRRCTQLTVEFQHSTAFTGYQINGLSIIANSGSERVSVG